MPPAPLSRRRKVHCSSSSGLGIGGALAAPVGAGRFVIRATHERGVGVPSSRSLATASREATRFYEGGPGTGTFSSAVVPPPLARSEGASRQIGARTANRRRAPPPRGTHPPP